MSIGPRDEIKGMIAAQLVAARNAAMECYRRAMIGEQPFEGRQENLNQACLQSASGQGDCGARPRACGRAGCGRHRRARAMDTPAFPKADFKAGVRPRRKLAN
jgi:hypothetical protein